MSSTEQVRQIRNILDQLAKAEALDNDTWEAIYDCELKKVRELPRENIIASIKEAIGNSSKRRAVSVNVTPQSHHSN